MPPAVFLSYASQDAEPAQRICEALRAAGIEAWFDQSELRGGDAWDQKIRRQIKECALFIPLISANTNARSEGYFRLEWKLAVDRSHLMADDAPFIFPVAVDESSESTSRVPDRFREVQWMRLQKDGAEKIAARAAKLLAGDAKPETRAVKGERPWLRARNVWVVMGVLFALSWVMRPLVQTAKRAASQGTAATTPSKAGASEAATLARRAIDQVTTLGYTRDTLAASADLARKAAEIDSTLPLAWGARARVEGIWVQRNWDTSEPRRRSTRDLARRALALDPEEPNALWAEGTVLRAQRALPEAAAMYERALKRNPDDNYIRRSLGSTQSLLGHNEQAIATYEEAIRRAPRDPLSHTSIAIIYANTQGLRNNDPRSVDIALSHLDRALEIQPYVTALLWKAGFLAAYKGDVEGAEATLARLGSLPHEEATEDRAIFFRMWIPLLAHKPERALEAAALTTSRYFSDALVAQPVAWMKALSYRQAGRESAAAEEWRAAERVLRERLAANPDALITQAELAVTLAMLGRREEAPKSFARYDASMREQGRTGTPTQVRYYVAMGDARKAVAAIRESRKTLSIQTTDAVLARDPWYDGIRRSPEFKALLRPAAIPAAGTPR